MSGPLDGLVVVALEQAIAAPLATRHLADLGARVIKIERPGIGDFARHYDDAQGPGYSSWFLWLNRGKQSIELDVKTPQGRTTLLDLIGRADVFVQNLAVGAFDRICPLETLRRENPRLVTCSISGYGPDGPYRHRKAYDLLIQAEAGLVSLTGSPTAPAKAGLSIADVGGGMYAYSGILVALLKRASSGKGSHVEVSLFDALLEWLGHQVLYTDQLKRSPTRSGTRHATIAPYGPLECADGVSVVVAVQHAGEWDRLCKALGLPHLVDDPRFATNEGRVLHVDELMTALERETSSSPSGELIGRLEEAGLAWARMNDLADVLRHEQVVERDRWVGVSTPKGEFRTLRSPVAVTDLEIPMGPIPGLGEHTEEILQWLRTASERVATDVDD